MKSILTNYNETSIKTIKTGFSLWKENTLIITKSEFEISLNDTPKYLKIEYPSTAKVTFHIFC